MWILESSSELFQGRRMWLKPGKSYLFGRVKKDGVRFAIEHKTISRKHFIIRVEDVRDEDVGNIHARTVVVIEDQNSKAGTHVNGELIKNSSKELKNEENYIKPGSLPQDLIIRWHSYVLTYNLLKKEVKAGVLKDKQARIRELDIKAVSEYILGQTTHLVVNKRNTPKSLQALIDGRPLVAESFIDTLEYVATPSDLNEDENLSPLEQDFDNAWPAASDHLPPPGREPTLRPAEFYEPNPGRKNVFENFTFVFLDQTQYDNLLPPITTGHGKALLYKVVANETTTEELVTFLHNAAGSKGFGDAHKDVEKGGVILVRYKGDTGAEDWTNSLINDTSLKLDQRAIDQGEYLDAILANDASLLRQPVPFENSSGGPVASQAKVAAPVPVSESASIHASNSGIQPNPLDQSSSAPPPPPPPPPQTLHAQMSNGLRGIQASHNTSQPDPSQTMDEDESQPFAKRARFMVPKKSRVFNFDDDFDPNNAIPYEDHEEQDIASASEEQRQQTPPEARNGRHDVKEEPASSRKRHRPSSREASTGFDDEIEELLPAAAAMKKRKLAKEAQNGIVVEHTKAKPIPALLKKPKPDKDIDVRKIAKAQREAEQEQMKKEQDEIEEDLRLEPGQSLPVYDVETVLIELPTRTREGHEAHQGTSDRWDPKWNGRKNFKGFRRAKDNLNGDTGAESRRRNHTKVIVPLVDAKTSTYGMGDQYWDKTEEEKMRDREKKKKASQRTTQSQSDHSRATREHRSPTVHVTDDEDDQDVANGDNLQTSPELSRLQNEAAQITDHIVDIDEPRQTRASDTQTRTQSTSQSTRGGKRPANTTIGGAMNKKQKTLPVTVVHGSDSDDSDDMKFKFGSRRRGRGKT